ncbi:hypothetical protein OPV22_016585 [Ensete ventricosum]|uniref:Uncharacterized protein n=1 Tax=Ensete ventricosum TaxID=4639 RepID=A0AAV8QRW2_ENSVE|nr:hypothetical protein OPV22_016585 [Ensete ventricosum]
MSEAAREEKRRGKRDITLRKRETSAKSQGKIDEEENSQVIISHLPSNSAAALGVLASCKSWKCCPLELTSMEFSALPIVILKTHNSELLCSRVLMPQCEAVG